MNGKPKTDQNDDDAYVLDDATIEELDKTSLEAVTNDLTNTMKRPVMSIEESDDGEPDEPDAPDAIASED